MGLPTLNILFSMAASLLILVGMGKINSVSAAVIEASYPFFIVLAAFAFFWIRMAECGQSCWRVTYSHGCRCCSEVGLIGVFMRARLPGRYVGSEPARRGGACPRPAGAPLQGAGDP